MNSFISKYFVFFAGHTIRREFTLKYIKEFEKTECLSEEEIAQMQLSKITKLLSHAYSNSEHYRKIFTKSRLDLSEIKSIEDLLLIPELTKDHLRYEQNKILIKNCSEVLSKKTTGGSTGQAVTVLKSRHSMAKEDAAMWRALRWHGIDVGDRQARFWGSAFNKKKRLKNSIIDFLMNRIRLSAFESGEEEMHLFVRRIKKFKPHYFYGYTSILKEFTEFCSDNSIDTHQFMLKGIVTTSEPLSGDVRAYLSDTFHCPVINDYGSGETGPIAYECEFGGMHLMADNLLVEIVNCDGNHAKDGEQGEVVVTELNNYATPLIRYNIKDVVTMTSEKCECGRGLPLIKSVEGRDRDVLKGTGGQKVHGAFLNYIALECKNLNLGFKQYQAIQTKRDIVIVKVITDKGYCQKTNELIVRRLQEKLGLDMNIKIEIVDVIDREPSGKLRVVKCLI